ncbi:hypothetical protein K491DRAFT_422627 [Lophiostoma macrostomum CBS 122681]|uniref:Uncharacterized protein n=1 Tax=Lophiostoma macrostomum CBS 122681 TaxID=1314788 RepID=A0A6A6T9G6_9PLEO|nr:hypothetical protein K491DRAFT_422627 [Lophiostoma macrostomum CBS 122681]
MAPVCGLTAAANQLACAPPPALEVIVVVDRGGLDCLQTDVVIENLEAPNLHLESLAPCLAFPGRFGPARPGETGALACPGASADRAGQLGVQGMWYAGGRRPETLLSFEVPYQCQGGLKSSLGGYGGNGWSQKHEKVPRVSVSDVAVSPRGDYGMFSFVSGTGDVYMSDRSPLRERAVWIQQL